MWLVALSLVGLVVLLQLHPYAAAVALASLALVAAYPVHEADHLVAAGVAGAGLLLGGAGRRGARRGARSRRRGCCSTRGASAWVIGYDTIYALQDVEDDALVGVRSSARALGGAVRAGRRGCSTRAALMLWAAALWSVRADPLALARAAAGGGASGWQVATLAPADGANALARFRANRTTGLLVFLACVVVGTRL